MARKHGSKKGSGLGDVDVAPKTPRVRKPKVPEAIIELLPDNNFVRVTNAFPKAQRDPGAMQYLLGLHPSAHLVELNDTDFEIHFSDPATARKAFGEWFTKPHKKEPVLGLAIPWKHQFRDQKGMGEFADRVVSAEVE